MSTINTVENIRAWFLTCPVVSEVMTFGADYLGEQATECSIYSMPSPLSYHEDIMGNIEYNGKQKLNFLFALRAPYGADTQQNLDNIQFFNDLQDWMYQQNTAKALPIIAEGSVTSIMPEKTQFVSSATSDTAMYQMQCSLTYWRS